MDVADVFGKDHNLVLRKIRTFIADNPEIGLSNFGESEYPNSRGKSYPMYEMTEKGFFNVVMRFTGKRIFHLNKK